VKLLTDTHTLVWALAEPERLSQTARQLFAGEAEVIVSVANLWELILKHDKKNSLLTDPVPWWDKFVIRSGIQTIGIRASHVIALGQLPHIHRDPFDRILVAQAIVEKATLVSKDAHLAQYGAEVLW
jgi:PIN domain nuclease of toxin-antitoxin system